MYRGVLLWNLIKYGWPYFVVGTVVFTLIAYLFGDSISLDTGAVLLAVYFGFIIIGAIYRYSKSQRVEDSKQAAAEMRRVLQEVKEKDLIAPYVYEQQRSVRWNCEHCGTLNLGSKYCKSCKKKWNTEMDVKLLQAAINSALAAGDGDAATKGYEQLNWIKGWANVEKPSKKIPEAAKPVSEPAEVRRCPICAHPISANARFCERCGKRVSEL